MYTTAKTGMAIPLHNGVEQSLIVHQAAALLADAEALHSGVVIRLR
jgi:hypothetical protein